MNKREEIISLWFEMWLQKKDLGIFKIFSNNATYIESWGPRYDSSKKNKLWFNEWKSRGTVIKWDIKQFFHKENQTIIEWCFECQMEAEEATSFDGISLIEWTDDSKIEFLKEFGCNINNYDPYKSGNIPKFKNTEIGWF